MLIADVKIEKIIHVMNDFYKSTEKYYLINKGSDTSYAFVTISGILPILIQ